MENLSKDFQIKIKKKREKERDLQAKKMNINILYPMGLKSKILQKSSLTPSRILCKWRSISFSNLVEVHKSFPHAINDLRRGRIHGGWCNFTNKRDPNWAAHKLQDHFGVVHLCLHISGPMSNHADHDSRQRIWSLQKSPDPTNLIMIRTRLDPNWPQQQKKLLGAWTIWSYILCINQLDSWFMDQSRMETDSR